MTLVIFLRTGRRMISKERNAHTIYQVGFSHLDYKGFVPSLKSENIHGKTFGEATANAIDGGIFLKGFVLKPEEVFRTTAQDAFESYGKDYFFSFSRLTEVSDCLMIRQKK